MVVDAIKQQMGERYAIINADTGFVMCVGQTAELEFLEDTIIVPPIQLVVVQEEEDEDGHTSAS